MEISNVEHLDAVILYGIVNEKLRLECHDLDDFLAQFEFNKQHFLLKLEEMNCYYDARVNQLRQK